MGQCTSDPKSTSSTHNDYHCVSGSKNSSNRRCSSSGGALVTAGSLKRNSKGSVHEKRNSKGSVHEKRNSNGSVHEGQKKPSYIEPMVKIDISDESIYQSDFESDNDYNIGDCDAEHEYLEEMPENNQHNSRSFKSRRTSSANPVPFPVGQASEKNLSNRHAVQTPVSNSIFLVEDVVKKSGCETFVINFNDGSDKPKPVPHMIKKLPRPKTTAACSSSNRLKVKPSNSVSKDIDFKPSSSAISVSDKPTRLHSSRQKKGPYEQSQEVNTSKVLDKRRRGLRSAFAGKGRPKKTSLAESAAVSTISTGTTRGRDRTFSCPSEN